MNPQEECWCTDEVDFECDECHYPCTDCDRMDWEYSHEETIASKIKERKMNLYKQLKRQESSKIIEDMLIGIVKRPKLN